MPSITVKNLPEGLAERLRASAKDNRRSLNSEILSRLELSLATRPRKSAEETIADLRRLHQRLAYLAPLTEEDIERGIDEGRR